MLSAVSASDDVSSDNLTVEDNTFDSIEEVSDDIELNKESPQEKDFPLDAALDDDIVADKKTVSMELDIVSRPIGTQGSPDSEGNSFVVDPELQYFVQVKISDKVNGTYSLYIDNKYIQDKNVSSKTHYLNLNELSNGKHVIKVDYSGNDEYQPTSAQFDYEIISCHMWYDDVVYGDTFFSVEFSGNNITGNAVAIIDGKRYTAPIVRGYAFFEIPLLNEGKHNLHIDYLGDSRHAPQSYDDNLYVIYQILSSYQVGYNQDNAVSLKLPKNAKGNLLVNIDGETVSNVKLVNGYASVSLNKFKDIGKSYDLFAEYTGTDYYVNSIDETFLNGPYIQLESQLIQNQETTLTFELPNSYSGTLYLEVPGYDGKISSKVVNGKAFVKFTAKESGYIDINYVDDSGYEYDDWLDIFVGPNPNMVATVESKVNQNPVFKVNVANDAGGAISVIVNGKEYTSAYFTKSGSLTIPGLADGKYIAIVTYSGDYKYPSVSKTLTFTKTSKKTTKTSLKLKKVTVKKSAKKLVLKATLKINGKDVKGKKITFKFNKKTYKAKTDKKGVAKVTVKKSVLKKLKVGKKVKYQASYGKTTVKKTVKVKK